ncbi:MAG: (Fe-S)-binding protein [Chloroflexales bacterium]|nr:(Fe-S)-binding protein [Chloroflexales bacterium]
MSTAEVTAPAALPNSLARAAVHSFVHTTGAWVASQLEACTRCGICAQACHFYEATGNPEFAPVWKVELLRRAYEQRFTVGGKLKLALGVEKRISDADIEHWSTIVYEACTLCNKCAMVCPMGIQLGPLIHDVREAMAEAGVVPADLLVAVRKQEELGSPLGVTDDAWADRIEWIADEWEVEIPIDVKGAETLVAFTSIELMKFPENIVAIAKILNAAGEKWTISSPGREVVNFGVFEGNPDRVKLFMGRLFDAARALGVKRLVVTECGHAYDLLRWTAHNMAEVPCAVTHIVAVIDELMRSGRIKLRAGAFDEGGTLTFHDACKIQRRGGHIQEPRDILKVLAPTAFKELALNREASMCCGGGGGVIAIKEADALRHKVFELKIRQMEEVGATRVAMTCANCRLQFTESLQHFGSPIKAVGLAHMVAEALSEEE